MEGLAAVRDVRVAGAPQFAALVLEQRALPPSRAGLDAVRSSPQRRIASGFDDMALVEKRSFVEKRDIRRAAASLDGPGSPPLVRDRGSPLQRHAVADRALRWLRTTRTARASRVAVNVWHGCADRASGRGCACIGSLAMSYFDTTGRLDVLSGGVRMVPITTPAGTHRAWTKRTGNNPATKMLLLHG